MGTQALNLKFCKSRQSIVPHFKADVHTMEIGNIGDIDLLQATTIHRPYVLYFRIYFFSE